METKAPWLSKTIIFNILFALAALYPPVLDWMAKNTQLLVLLWSGVGVVLRLVSKGKIVLSDV